MKIPTINVIEYFNNTISQVISFPDDLRGNKNAEKTFTKILREHGINEDTSDYISDGIYEDDNGYQCFLVYSTN